MNPDDNPIKYLNSVTANHKFSFKIISEESMLTSLMMLKSGKAPGPDGVSTNLVKDVGTPTFKSGAPNEKNNYRPISVLSVFAKLFEKIVHDQLSDFSFLIEY